MSKKLSRAEKQYMREMGKVVEEDGDEGDFEKEFKEKENKRMDREMGNMMDGLMGQFGGNDDSRHVMNSNIRQQQPAKKTTTTTTTTTYVTKQHSKPSGSNSNNNNNIGQKNQIIKTTVEKKYMDDEAKMIKNELDKSKLERNKMLDDMRKEQAMKNNKK